MLVNEVLLGGNLTASNILYNDTNVDLGSNQHGSFEILNSAFPISQGAVLASGGITEIMGEYSPPDGNLQNDSDLMMLSGGYNMNNCAIIEFDIVAVSDTFLIDFIFASMEYPSFTCTQFNDVFGLFISGPGLEGPFMNDAVNIARIPGTEVPIGVNTVNSGQPTGAGNIPICLDADPNFQADSIYFISNNPPLDNSISIPGHTHMFTAFASLIPGETYHIKFAIANALDQSLQSAVFLRKGSVSNISGLDPLEISVNADNIDVAPEGLYIAGTFNYFIPEPMELNAEGDYTFEAMVPAGINVTYKFYNGNGPDAQELVNEDCGISGAMSDLSRYVLMTDEPLSVETVCFGDCDALCADISSTVDVKKEQLEIFPNPSAGTVQIILPEIGSSQMQVQVFDLTGKRVIERNINSKPGNSYSLDIASLHSGIYVVQITTDDVTYANKLLKE